MLNKNDRIIVESIKRASHIRLIFDGQTVDLAQSKTLSHDLPRPVRMKTRGARAEWLGLYPSIIEVIEEDQE